MDSTIKAGRNDYSFVQLSPLSLLYHVDGMNSQAIL